MSPPSRITVTGPYKDLPLSGSVVTAAHGSPKTWSMTMLPPQSPDTFRYGSGELKNPSEMSPSSWKAPSESTLTVLKCEQIWNTDRLTRHQICLTNVWPWQQRWIRLPAVVVSTAGLIQIPQLHFGGSWRAIVGAEDVPCHSHGIGRSSGDEAKEDKQAYD